ncbi:hypothetical protein L3Q82_015353, partial [Scortum barcoo]
IIHQIVEEKTSVTLPCPHAVDRKVTWSREKDERKVDIFTVDGDREIRHDTDRRYSTLADKSLYINSVTVSDSGRYFCNEAAVELTVIPSDAPYLWQTSVRLVIGILYLIVMISIIIFTWRKAHQIKKQHATEPGNDV